MQFLPNVEAQIRSPSHISAQMVTITTIKLQTFTPIYFYGYYVIFNFTLMCETRVSKILLLSSSDVASTPGKPLVMSFSSRTVKLSWAPPLDVNNSPIREYLIKVDITIEYLIKVASCCSFKWIKYKLLGFCPELIPKTVCAINVMIRKIGKRKKKFDNLVWSTF